MLRSQRTQRTTNLHESVSHTMKHMGILKEEDFDQEEDQGGTAYAVFLVAEMVSSGSYAATTRPDSDEVGLPGGKVDAGESEIEALVRECTEEGWILPANAEFTEVQRKDVDGNEVAWYSLKKGVPRMAKEYKEKGRITPIIAQDHELAKSHGNEFLLSDSI